jgi:lysyl-tRNA synthetase class 2
LGGRHIFPVIIVPSEAVKFHGLTDTEAKYRKRYLDLIVNEETRKTFEIRAKVVPGIRAFLTNERFMEVETPMMHVIPGGASAKPFVTHHNALDMELYLRIAPELYLKRLVVGGFERVFEINRNFRNEGVSTRHNPEFTMIEFYQAYADYKDLMALNENMLEKLAIDILGSTDVPYGDEVYSFKGPFKKISMFDAILEHNPDFTPENVNDREFLAKFTQDVLKEKVKPGFGLGKLQTIVFEETVETKLRQPTFITEYPAETSPLARRNDDNPHVTDRFEFFIGGRELANGFSELNDPIDQAERFQAQVAEKDAGDDEAMHYDADFIEALEYGLPPTALPVLLPAGPAGAWPWAAVAGAAAGLRLPALPRRLRRRSHPAWRSRQALRRLPLPARLRLPARRLLPSYRQTGRLLS